MSIARAVPENVRQGAVTPLNSLHAWRETWMQSVNDPDAFWLQEAREQIRWMRAPTRGCQGDFYSVQDAPIRWFADGVLNITESCLDRHVETSPTPSRSFGKPTMSETDAPSPTKNSWTT